MRIAELSARTGVPVATIKYYLREGLLPRGLLSAPNQADYGEDHVARLRLIRLLRDVADTPIDRIRHVMAAIDDAAAGSHQAMAAVADALAPVPPDPGPAAEPVRAVVDQLIAEVGWTRLRPDAVDRENLRAVLEVIVASGTHEGRLDILTAYAQAADHIARFEVADLDDAAGRHDLLSQMVIGQVVFGELLATLRRLAEEHHSAVRFDGDGPQSAPGSRRSRSRRA